MGRKIGGRFAAAWTLALLLAGCAGLPVETPLTRADKALGGTGLKTLRYTGSGTGATFGQAYQPGMAWPRLNYSSFSRVLDFENGALREDYARSRAEPTGGGAVPLIGMGEQRVTGLMRGGFAWNLAGTTASAAPLAVDGRIHDLWTSPHGVVKAALRNNPELSQEGSKLVVRFTEPGRFSATAWLDAAGMVERVDTVQPNPVLGDMRTATLYSGYRDFNGVKFPTRIVQHQAGSVVLEMSVHTVEANAPSGIEVPEAVRGFTERVAAQKAAEGVWFLGGGSHNSVAIEMEDHVILVESPLYDGRALAVLAEVKRLVPAKPVRWVINSHHHFDHAGGLRAAASQGATLVVSEQARPWFERVLANPNRISPDALAKSGRKVELSGVDGQRSFSDGKRTVELFMLEDSVHAQGFMVVWLPAERLLVEADAWTPGPPDAPPPQVHNANNINLLLNIERLRLDVDRILPLHGRIATLRELGTAAGR